MDSEKPVIFISYSRKDEVVANLLAYILEQIGIHCHYDRKLEVSKNWTEMLQKMLNESSLVIILLTKNAVSSPTVNQEIGFALAQEKVIWPICIDKDVLPKGLIENIQPYLQFDWNNPGNIINVLVDIINENAQRAKKCAPLSKSIKNYIQNSNDNAYKALGLKQVIEGRKSRTQFIVDELNGILQKTKSPIHLYHQSGFSIFCVEDTPKFRQASGHSADYIKLLIEERTAMEDILKKPGTILKLILWPVKSYDKKFLAIRYENLLTWLENVKGSKSIQFVLNEHSGKNRYIVKGELCLDGEKFKEKMGYDMNIARYDNLSIDRAIEDFESIFESADHNKENTIARIRKMYEHYSQYSEL